MRCAELISYSSPVPFYINTRTGCLILELLLFDKFETFLKDFFFISTVTYMDHGDTWIFQLGAAMISTQKIRKPEERQPLSSGKH